MRPPSGEVKGCGTGPADSSWHPRPIRGYWAVALCPGVGTYPQRATPRRHRRSQERRTLKAVAITFYVLSTYVTLEGVRSLFGSEAPETSWIGVGRLIASIIIMPVLAREKTKVAQQLDGDSLIPADAAETRILRAAQQLNPARPLRADRCAWLDPSPDSSSPPSRSTRVARDGRASSWKTTTERPNDLSQPRTRIHAPLGFQPSSWATFT